MDWMPFHMESHGPVEWGPHGGDCFARAKARVRPGTRAANNCATPVEIRSTCARARTPSGRQSSALSRRLLADYEGSLLVSSPATRKAGPQVLVVKDYVRAP
jgi:hypothetical protein